MNVYSNLHQYLQPEVDILIRIPSYRSSLSSRIDHFRSLNAGIDQLFKDFTNIRMTNQFFHFYFVPFVFAVTQVLPVIVQMFTSSIDKSIHLCSVSLGAAT